MTRKNTIRRKSRTLSRALAALAVVVGAGLLTAAPAHADGPHFSFSFGVPFQFFPVPVYEPPQYYEPEPEVYYSPPVVYAPAPVYMERPVYYGHPYYGHDHGRHRGWDHHHEVRGDRGYYRDR